MLNYFSSFFLLDFPEESSGFYLETLQVGDTENHLQHYHHFLSTLIKGRSEDRLDKSKNEWNLLGIPNNYLYQWIKNSSSVLTSARFFHYEKQELINRLKVDGLKKGLQDLVDDLSVKANHQFSIINAFWGEDNVGSGLDQLFYKKLVHDLHSQPVWFINNNRLENFDIDTIHLEFLILADNFNFIDYFPFIRYDENGWIDYFMLTRSELEDKALFSQSYRKLQKLQELQNLQGKEKERKEQNWIENWQVNQAKKLLLSIEQGRQFKLKISPIKFKLKLLSEAREARKKVLLVEGHDLRVLKAVDKAVRHGVEGMVVMGSRIEIEKLAGEHHLKHLTKVEVIEPQDYHEQYTPTVYEKMKKKGISMEEAGEMIKNDLVLAGVLLDQDIVDGAVAGAHYSTADTLKAAIRMVGLQPGHEIISSFFFMLLPQDVKVFADCAVNPSPGASQLADITLQSIESARRFFQLPIYVSLISFSTMASAKTPEVEKIEESIKLIYERNKEMDFKDTLIEGPVQYDAATNYEISRKKFPKSNIAGRSNVLIFPNLETGNTVYKAVQQSLRHQDCDCIGPVIQGLRKPYNDLSRGATVEDIFQTILITMVQSQVSKVSKGE